MTTPGENWVTVDTRPLNWDLYQVGRQTARLVERIMKGAKPADIPVERPTRFELVVNRRTAATLGLTIPPEVLLRVDRFIE
jgi:putative ABC transport system substrate-binding protein